MNACRAAAVGLVLVAGGCGCTQRSDWSDSDLEELCELLALNEPDPTSGELEGSFLMCEWFRDGQITEDQYLEFCFLDYESRAAYIDLEEYCTVTTEPEVAGDFSSAVAEWRSGAEGHDCDPGDSPPLSVFTGECGDGIVFLATNFGLGGGFDFYDGGSGVFVGQLGWADFVLPPCCGVVYWPSRIECPDAIVTEVICGAEIEVGDSVPFP